MPSTRLSYDSATRVFTLTTTDEYGEHIEQFTAPTGYSGQAFNVAGVDCCALVSALDCGGINDLEGYYGRTDYGN